MGRYMGKRVEEDENSKEEVVDYSKIIRTRAADVTAAAEGKRIMKMTTAPYNVYELRIRRRRRTNIPVSSPRSFPTTFKDANIITTTTCSSNGGGSEVIVSSSDFPAEVEVEASCCSSNNNTSSLSLSLSSSSSSSDFLKKCVVASSSATTTTSAEIVADPAIIGDDEDEGEASSKFIDCCNKESSSMGSVGVEISENYSRKVETKKRLVEEAEMNVLDYPSAATKSTVQIKPVMMPSESEIDDFFSSAENDLQKRFSDKYNFDIVKDVPLEGRYEWVEIKP